MNTGEGFPSREASVSPENVNGKLIHLGRMEILAPGLEWDGGISADTEETRLTEVEKAEYLKLLGQSIVKTQSGGQEMCMDGRPLGFSLPLGPKTAGGTQSDAERIVLASYAYDEHNPIAHKEALQIMFKVLSGLGFTPGGHDLGQCGAFKYSKDAIILTIEKSKDVAHAVETLLGAVESTYSDQSQDKIITAANVVSEKHGSLFLGHEKATEALQAENPSSCPTLGSSHKELAIAVFGDVDATVDNDRLVNLTSRSPVLGRELHAFGYNWGLHNAVADYLGGEQGQLYKHAVASMDVPTLTKLTDGSLDMYGFQPTSV